MVEMRTPPCLGPGCARGAVRRATAESKRASPHSGGSETTQAEAPRSRTSHSYERPDVEQMLPVQPAESHHETKPRQPRRCPKGVTPRTPGAFARTSSSRRASANLRTHPRLERHGQPPGRARARRRARTPRRLPHAHLSSEPSAASPAPMAARSTVPRPRSATASTQIGAAHPPQPARRHVSAHGRRLQPHRQHRARTPRRQPQAVHISAHGRSLEPRPQHRARTPRRQPHAVLSSELCAAKLARRRPRGAQVRDREAARRPRGSAQHLLPTPLGLTFRRTAPAPNLPRSPASDPKPTVRAPARRPALLLGSKRGGPDDRAVADALPPEKEFEPHGRDTP